MDVSLKYIYPILFCCLTPMVNAASSDADGNPVAVSAIRDADQVVGGYEGKRGDGYISSTDSPYQVMYLPDNETTFYLPESGENYTLADIDYYYAAYGGSQFSTKVNQPDEDSKKLVYFEGSLADQADVTLSGAGAYGIFYKNYTADVTINNSNRATVVIDSNYAAGATLNNDNANLYLISDIAQNARINNSNNGYMKIVDSDASNVVLVNDDSEMHILNSFTAGANMKNINGGKLYVSNNNVSNTTIVNDGSLFVATNNLANNAKFDNLNQATFIFNGGNITGSTVLNDNSSITMTDVQGDHSTMTNQNAGQLALENVNGSDYLLNNGSGNPQDNSAMTLQGDNTVSLSTVNNLAYASMSISGYLNFTSSTMNNQSQVTFHDLVMQGGTVESSGNLLGIASSFSALTLTNHNNGQVQFSDVTIDSSSLTNGSGLAGDSSALLLQGNNTVTNSVITNQQNASTTLAGNLDFTGSTLVNQSALRLQNLTMKGGEITGNMLRTLRSSPAEYSSTLINANNSHSVLTDVTVTQSSLLNGSGEANDHSSLALQGDSVVTNSVIENQPNSTLSLSGQLDFSGSTLNNQSTTSLDQLAMKGGLITNNGQLVVNSSSTTGSLFNSGNILLSHCRGCETRTLTVNGDYVGDNGTITVATNLTDGETRTDKLVITGNASGTTYVAFSNRSDSNAPVVDTVKVFETGSSTADAFVQRQRVVAGGYDYQLQQGLASDSHNWYLSNLKNGQRMTRPEGGSYATNLAAASTLFNTRLSDRLSADSQVDSVTGQANASSLWLRVLAAHNSGQLVGDTTTYTANRSLTQLGGDLLAGSLRGKDGYHVGVMAGYGKQNSKSHNAVTGYGSRGEVTGYSAGLYGTWYQNEQDKTGLYVDSWMLYNWFNNTVTNNSTGDEKYRSKGITASVESGYTQSLMTFTTDGGMENTLFLRPQAQLTWSGVSAADHTEQNGDVVKGLGTDNLQTRLGVRLSLSGKRVQDDHRYRLFEPYIEANWLYNSKRYGVKMANDSLFLQGARNVAELKAGVEGYLTDNLSVQGYVSRQMGTHDYRDTQGMFNINYHF